VNQGCWFEMGFGAMSAMTLIPCACRPEVISSNSARADGSKGLSQIASTPSAARYGIWEMTPRRSLASSAPPVSSAPEPAKPRG